MILVLLIFIVIFSICLYFSLRTEKKASKTPLLLYDGKMTPFKPQITLTREHLGVPLQLPRIESYHVNKRKKGRRSVTLTLPQLLKPSDIITIQAPKHSYNKSSTIKVKGFQILINGKFKEEVYLWQTREGGDVTFKYEENEWGYYYWKAEGGKNLRENATQNSTSKNIQEGIRQCVGAAGSAASDDLPAIGASIPEAYECMQSMGCILGIGSCDDKTQDPPLTNQDILNDMTIVLQKEVQVEAAAELFTTWSQFSGGTLSDKTANSSWYNYKNTLTNNIQANRNLLLEYGKGGDPELLYSNSSYDSQEIRKFLVSANTVTYGKDACNEFPGVLCNMIGIYEYALDAFVASDFSAAFGPGWTSLDNVTLFPFYTQVMQSYLTTLREMALRSPMQNESGKYFPPWQLIANQTNYQETVSARLPLAYKFYNQYVSQYLTRIVWETNTFDCNAGVRPTYAINYCAYNPNFSQDTEGNITCFVQNGQNIQNTKVDIDSDGTKSPYVGVNHASLVDNNYNTTTNEQLLSEWDQNGFSSSAANYPQGGFPGWAPTINRFIAPFSGDTKAWFCLTDDMLVGQRDAILQAVKLSITDILHDHNGRPFDLYDSMAASAGLTCSQSEINGSATGNWSCFPTNLSYTENGEDFILGSFFGNFGVPNLSMTDNGTDLFSSERITIVQDFSFEYANGYAFDASVFSTTGYFTSNSVLCCPSNTTFVIGGSKLSISESLGSEQFPDIRRELNCGALFDVGNQIMLPGYTGRASACVDIPPQIASATVMPILYGVIDDFTNQIFSGLLSTGLLDLPPINNQSNIRPKAKFVNFGVPLQLQSSVIPSSFPESTAIQFLKYDPNQTWNYNYGPIPDQLMYMYNIDKTFFNQPLVEGTRINVTMGTYTQIYTYTMIPSSMTNKSLTAFTWLNGAPYCGTDAQCGDCENNETGILAFYPDSSFVPTQVVGSCSDPNSIMYTEYDGLFFVPFDAAASEKFADGLPQPSTICSLPSYSTFLYDNISLANPQMVAYNFYFTAAYSVPLPTIVTVTDHTNSVIVTNTGLQNNYNMQMGTWSHLNIAYSDGNSPPSLVFGIQSGQCSASCLTGTSFEFIETTASSNNLATELTAGNIYAVRVFEFLEQWADAPTNPATCQNEPVPLCNACPFSSKFSNFNWSGYLPGDVEVAPNWTVVFNYENY